MVVVSNLRKEHKGRREGFSLNKTRKVTTKNISFCVQKGILHWLRLSLCLLGGNSLWKCLFTSPGEVLGLLGPNGAGKSSVMHMLSGDTDPTAGQVQTRLAVLLSQVPAAGVKVSDLSRCQRLKSGSFSCRC